MSKHSLFNEIFYDKNSSKKSKNESEEVEDEKLELSDENNDSANISFVGSPVYPRIFWGDSAKPLMGQYPNSEYVDDNIHRTYQGLLSYFG
jgi:hypothetical protein